MTKEVIGVEALKKKLDGIKEELHPKLVAQSVRASMVPMMKQARQNAPQGKDVHRTYKGRLVAPGFLKRNIKLRKMKFKDKTKVGYSLAARKEAFYGKIIEQGFRDVSAKPWLGEAYNSTKSQVESNFRRALLKRIEKGKRKGQGK